MGGMHAYEPHTLAAILAATSTSMLAGLLCADQDYKARAAETIARHIVDRLGAPPRPDHNQLMLPF